jgi:hypothetical protein
VLAVSRPARPAVELNDDGKISRLAIVWDGSLLDDDAISALTLLVVERN